MVIRCCVGFIALVVVLIGCKGDRGPNGPPGPPGDGTETLTDPRIMPKVIYTYPENNSVGPYSEFINGFSGRIVVRFNKIMDIPSLRSALSLSLASDSTTTYPVALSIGSGDVVVIESYDAFGYLGRLTVGKTYVLKIAAEAKDVNGNTLGFPFSMRLTPEPLLRIVEVSPKDQKQNVSAAPAISITFNGVVDNSIFSSVRFDPMISGSWSAYIVGRIDFTPSSWLKNDSTYLITVDTSAVDVYGNHLMNPLSWQFTTRPFSILATNPSNEEIAWIYTGVTIATSGCLDTASVRNAFSIEPSVPSVRGAYAEVNQVLFRPIGTLSSATRYTVTVSKSLKTIYGDSLTAPYTFSFTTY